LSRIAKKKAKSPDFPRLFQNFSAFYGHSEKQNAEKKCFSAMKKAKIV